MPGRKIILTQHELAMGGIDRVSRYLANGFADAGYDTEYLVFCEGGRGTNNLQPSLKNAVRLTHLTDQRKSRSRDLTGNVFACAKHLKETKPDCVISTCNNMNWITALAVKLSGIETKMVLKVTNPIVRSSDNIMGMATRRYGYRRAFEYADTVLTLSDAETRLLAAAFPTAASSFQTVINPYVTEEMCAAPHSASASQTDKIILGVGRFEPQKNMSLLIRAFAQIADRETKLVILGEGEEYVTCRQLCVELGVAGRVMMPGFVNDVAQWYRKASLFVLTSVYEGLPAVVLEAMAANCPVLTTDCFPAARELMAQSQPCEIIENLAPDQIARQITRAMQTKAHGNLKQVAVKYSVQNGIDDHIRIVAELLKA